MTLRERLFGSDEPDFPDPPAGEGWQVVPTDALRRAQLDRIEAKLDRVLETVEDDQESDAEAAANALADEIRRQYPNR